VFFSPIAPGIHHWLKWQVGRGTSRLGRVCYWPEWQQTSLQGAAVLWGGPGGLPNRYATLTWVFMFLWLKWMWIRKRLLEEESRKFSIIVV